MLTRAIAQIRHALGDDPQQPRYVQTRHAVGYRFVGELEAAREPMDAGTAGGPTAPTMVRTTAEHAEGPGQPAAAGPRRRRWALLVAAGVVAVIAWLLVPRPGPRVMETASLAIIPFTPLSDASEDRWFAEGLASELHAALAEQPGLRVAAWSRPAPGESDPRAAAQRLGVGHVLDATVRREGTRIRVSARLVHARSGMVLWSRSYDRQLRDVFATQADIARNVARELGARLGDEAALARRLAPTRDVDAFLAYLRGLHLASALGGDAHAAQAHAAFDDALARDAGFARAQAGICRVELWRFEGHRDAGGFEAAREACQRAHNMNRSDLSVRVLLGDLLRVQGLADQAAAEYRAALDMPSLRARALLGLARLDIDGGRPQAALARLREAAATDRTDARLQADVGYQTYLLGDVPRAIDHLALAARLAPSDAQVWGLHGALLLTAGRNAEAARALERALAIEPSESVLANLATLRYEQGDYTAAAALYSRAIARYPGNFQLHGNLGDALWAAPATRTAATQAFGEAARRAQAYVGLNPDDAKALAALGWYRAALGEHGAGIELALRAETLGREPAEVAYYNAQTFALAGREDDARRRVTRALDAGASPTRVAGNAVLRAAGVAPGPAPSAIPTAPQESRP